MVRTRICDVKSWEPDSESDFEYFRSLPWCAKVISTSTVKPFKSDFPFRTKRGGDPVVDDFMCNDGGILRHINLIAEPGTIPRLDPNQSLAPISVSDTPGGDLTASTKEPPPIDEDLRKDEYPVHIDLFTLGPALQGFPDTIFGGILTLLADSCCGKTAYMHRDPEHQIRTAYMNTRFVKPLNIGPDGTVTILVKSQVSRRLSTRGKIVVLASMEGPEAIVYATAEGMLVERLSKGKL